MIFNIVYFSLCNKTLNMLFHPNWQMDFRKVFERKNIVAVSFVKSLSMHSYIVHNLKLFKLENLVFTHLHISNEYMNCIHFKWSD